MEKFRILVENCKAFISFTDDDVERLNLILPRLKNFIPEIISYVVDRITINKEISKLLNKHPLPVEKVVEILEDWLLNVFSWNYGEDFGEKAYHIGNVHAKSGVKPMFISLTLGNFLIATSSVLSTIIDDPQIREQYLSSVQKAFILNMTIMLESYERHRED
jgi:hypothetical protein